MPYWKCFLFAAVAVLTIFGFIYAIALLVQWLAAAAPVWAFSAFIVIFTIVGLSLVLWID